ncbi:hypothetical protein [Novosphingobium sp. B1]|uniref:hypothetical protein n=1 Tax=Novosphingobium sp. B1 TaxID=1938756 RepID=UPI0009D89098|nr:hypothetical protein [Novosphingobium sp. B1]SMC40539.1 hypothetical protein SAMN06272759_102242 [Novosphingobium sp. B1]
MIGKIISAVVGKKIAERTPGMSEGTGAIVGLAAATLARRMGPLGMIAAAGGTWAISRAMKKKQAREFGRTY